MVKLPLARIRPSGLKLTDKMDYSSPAETFKHGPVAISHNHYPLVEATTGENLTILDSKLVTLPN
jgi:hypothetical protein